MNHLLYKAFTLISILWFISTCTPEKRDKIPITSSYPEAVSLYKKATEFENLHKNDSALHFYNRAIKEDSLFVLAHLRKALLTNDLASRLVIIENAMIHMHRVSEGERLWLRASHKFTTGSATSMDYKLFDSLVRLYPEDPNANYHFGIISFSHGNNKFDQAVEHLEKTVSLQPNFANAYNELAYAYLELSDYSNAKKAALRFIKLVPDKPAPLELYAEILMREGSYNQSIKAYEEIFEMAPDHVWAFMGIAANLNFLNRHKAARTMLEKMDTLNLTDYQFRHKFRSKVVSYLDEGQMDAAISVLEYQRQIGVDKVSEFEPFFHAFFAYLRITRLQFESGDWKNGWATFKQWQMYVLENSSTLATHNRVNNYEYYYRAYMFYLRGMMDDAESELEKYRVAFEENDNYFILKSRILKSQNEYKKAQEFIMQSNLNNPYNQFEFAEILRDLEEQDAALNWYKKVAGTNKMNDIDLALVRKKAIDRINSCF